MTTAPILIDSDSEDAHDDAHPPLSQSVVRPVESTNKTLSSSQGHLRDVSSPESSLPSFRDLFRRNGPRQRVNSIASTFIDIRDASPSQPRPSHRTGSLRRITSLPTKSPSQAKVKGASAIEIIELGSDSILASSDRGVDSEPELGPEAGHGLEPSSPIFSQFTPSRLPCHLAPGPVSNAARQRALQQAEADAARAGPSRLPEPIVLGSSPDPPPIVRVASRRTEEVSRSKSLSEKTFRIASSPAPPSSPLAEPMSLAPVGNRAGSLQRKTSLLDALDALQTLHEVADETDEAEARSDNGGRSASASPPPPTRRKRAKAQSSSPEKQRKRTTQPNAVGRGARLFSSDTENDVRPGKAASTAMATTAASARLERAAATKAAKEAEREAKRREREAKKAETRRAAAEKKRWAEANRLRRGKGDTMKELLVDFDERLCNDSGDGDGDGDGAVLKPCFDTIRERMEKDGATVATFSPSGGTTLATVRFRRKVKARLNAVRRSWIPLETEVIEAEKVVLVVLEGKELVRMVQDATLADAVQALRDGLPTAGYQILLVVQGLHKHFARLKANENRAYAARIRSQLAADSAATTAGGGARRPGGSGGSSGNAALVPGTATTIQERVEMALLGLQVTERCFVVHANGLVDLTEWICTLTADISMRPYKVLRNSFLSFCPDGGAPGGGGGNARNSTGADHEQTFRLMLMQIPRVTAHVADAILLRFPTLDTLYRAYRRCGSQDDIDALLADCQVESNLDGSARSAHRRGIGIQLSKRIAAVLMGCDPLALVGGPI
ncbi:hypothetical protein ACQY0O_002126 [Thecaphora frezii]